MINITKKSVMIVGDSPEAVEPLSKMLESRGYQTLKAYSGRECIDLARNKRPDVLILSVYSESMNGWQIAKTMKKDPDLKEIPIIVIGSELTLDDILIRSDLIENFISKQISLTK